MWSTLSWFWYRVKDRDLFWVFYMWVSSFISNICLRGSLFSIMCFVHLYQRSAGYSCVGLCLGPLFWSIGLPVVFVPIPCCFYCYPSVVYFEVKRCVSLIFMTAFPCLFTSSQDTWIEFLQEVKLNISK
jgi:hypothetical protein